MTELLRAALVFAGALLALLTLGAFVKRLAARLKQRLAEERAKDEEAEKKIAEAAAKARADMQEALSAMERAVSFGLNQAPRLEICDERAFEMERRRALKLSIATTLFERGIFRRPESCIEAAGEFTRAALTAGLLPRTREEEILGEAPKVAPPTAGNKPYSET